MKRLVLILLLFAAPALLAQSLGDVAREQRGETGHPKAKRVFTNDDLSTAPAQAPSVAAPTPDANSASATNPASPGQPTGPENPANRTNPANPGAAANNGARPAKPAAQPGAPAQPEDPLKAQQQRHLNEMVQRMQFLEFEIKDLTQQRNNMAASQHYGDANRAESTAAMADLTQQIAHKNAELNALRDEFVEARDRYSQTSVIR